MATTVPLHLIRSHLQYINKGARARTARVKFADILMKLETPYFNLITQTEGKSQARGAVMFLDLVTFQTP